MAEPTQDKIHTIIERGGKFFERETVTKTVKEKATQKTLVPPHAVDEYTRNGYKVVETLRGGSVNMEKVVDVERQVPEVIEHEVKLERVGK